jgi:hypothetical protein
VWSIHRADSVTHNDKVIISVMGGTENLQIDISYECAEGLIFVTAIFTRF